MDISQHSAHHETVHLIANLDELERKLFFVGQLSFRSFKVRILNIHFESGSHLSLLQLYRNGLEENQAKSTQLL